MTSPAVPETVDFRKILRSPDAPCTPITIADHWRQTMRPDELDRLKKQIGVIIDTPDALETIIKNILENDPVALRTWGRAVIGAAYGEDKHITDTGTDYLTGAHNRAGRDRWLAANYGIGQEGGRRHRAPRSLLYVDADLTNFKIVNDVLGHEIGDAVLVEGVRSLRKSIRETDMIARDGGDEFKVYIPDVSSADSDRILKRLVAAEEHKARQFSGPAWTAIMTSLNSFEHQEIICTVEDSTLPNDTESARVLCINGEAVTPLSRLAIYSMGGAYGKINHFESSTFYEMRRAAKAAMVARKRHLQSIMGGAYRTKVHQ